MLPCLECAAFRTWVMPSLCNVFLFCATALENKQNRHIWKDESCFSLRQTPNTYTFPMYRLGQTSSNGVSPSLQESKMSCSSLMAARSRCQLLLDIFSPAESSSNKPQHSPCSLCPMPLRYHSMNSWLRDTSRWLFECSPAPKLALCSACALCMWSYLTLFCYWFQSIPALSVITEDRPGNQYACYLLRTHKMVQREPVLNKIEDIYQVYLTVVWFLLF